ncbi:flagellar basal body P-ring formation chaperone FlgA [Thalassobaculum sp.]|uniref:flagellar basal body P-ring formation chaperone FlgA n=1 Tax=Thalassobaculum sp. TaxID=2022740 RepID=UPI0032EBF9EF
MNRTARTITSVALAAVLLGSGAAQAATATGDALPLILKQRVIVGGDGIRLSDLFANVPPANDGRIADAPQPGGRHVFGVRELFHYAKSFGLQWRPRDMKVYSEVVRDSAPVPIELIRDALARVIEPQRRGDDFDVEIFNRDLPLFVATGTVPDVLVRNLAYDPRSNRFDATISVPGSQATPVVVSGRVEPMLSVPVLRSHAMPGEVITENDIQWLRVESRRASMNSVTRLEDLLGRTPRRPIVGGQPIRLTDIRPNFVIDKGDLVTIVLNSGTMTLTARAEATEKGAVGDIIRVRNNHSRKVLEARVTGAGTVTITGSQVASIN